MIGATQMTHPHMILDDTGLCDALSDGELQHAVAAALIWQESDNVWRLYADVEWSDLDRSRSDYHKASRLVARIPTYKG